MYFQDAIRILLRRWYVVLAGLLLILAASGAAVALVPTDYQASGQVLLLLPADATGVATPTNPYLNLQSGLTVTASLIAGNVTTKDAQRDMVANGFTSDYAVALNPGTGPLLIVTAEDNDTDAAVATRDEVIRRLARELERIQLEESVPTSQIIHSRTDSVGTQAEALPGSKIRALAIVAAVGLVLTTIVAFIADRALLARSSNRRQRATGRGVGDVGEHSSAPHSLTSSPGNAITGSAKTTDPALKSGSRRLGVRKPPRDGEVNDGTAR